MLGKLNTVEQFWILQVHVPKWVFNVGNPAIAASEHVLKLKVLVVTLIQYKKKVVTLIQYKKKCFKSASSGAQSTALLLKHIPLYTVPCLVPVFDGLCGHVRIPRK